MKARFGILALALAYLPSVARACPVCFAARDEAERLALLATTVLLTALPVIMIGAIIYWIARRSRELDSEHTQTREPTDERPAAGSATAVSLQQRTR